MTIASSIRVLKSSLESVTPPMNLISIDGTIIYAVARHPKWQTVHFVLLAFDQNWRIACTGAYLQESWLEGVRATAAVTCRLCWNCINWNGNGTRRAEDGTWWSY